MAERKETPYEAWEFTEQEYPVAVVLTELQKKHIQTEMAVVASEKVMLAVPTDGNIETYLREQEYMRGKLDQLAALLMTSENAETALQKALQEAIEKQRNEIKPK